MKKKYYLLIVLSLILSGCSNSKDIVSEVDSNTSINTSTDDTAQTATESDDISGSFGSQFYTDDIENNAERGYDQELLELGFKGPEFYELLFQEASNSFVYTGLNLARSNESIENFIEYEGNVTYVGRFAPIIASYLESYHSYSDKYPNYPSYAIALDDPYFASKESILNFEKRYINFKKGNKFKNEVIVEINKYTTKDKEAVDLYLNSIFTSSGDDSPSVILSNLFFRDDVKPRELFNTKNDKILTTFLLINESSKTKYLCGLQSSELIPLSNLPEVATESYTKFFNSKKNDQMYSFLLPDFSKLESLVRSYIYPGLACFEVTAS